MVNSALRFETSMFRKQKHLVHYVSMGTFLALKLFCVWNARKKDKLNNKLQNKALVLVLLIVMLLIDLHYVRVYT